MCSTTDDETVPILGDIVIVDRKSKRLNETNPYDFCGMQGLKCL